MSVSLVAGQLPPVFFICLIISSLWLRSFCLWPVRFYPIFPHYPINGTFFSDKIYCTRKGQILHNSSLHTCVLCHPQCALIASHCVTHFLGLTHSQVSDVREAPETPRTLLLSGWRAIALQVQSVSSVLWSSHAGSKFSYIVYYNKVLY